MHSIQAATYGGVANQTDGRVGLAAITNFAHRPSFFESAGDSP